MKVVGSVVEYNPFHDGHAYHLKKAREIAGDDGEMVVVMSGNFVQRGEPSITDKYTRTRLALEAGVSAVFELPTSYCVSSAEGFAYGGMAILNGLGAVSDVVYGLEEGILHEDVIALSKILADEPEEYKLLLLEGLKAGKNFPSARYDAINKCAGKLAYVLENSNSILAVEYEKSLLKLNSKMNTHAITRSGMSHHKCASMIREEILSGKNTYGIDYSVCLDDFSELINYRLICESQSHLEELLDFNYDIANRFLALANKNLKASDLVNELSCKNYTQTRIKRCLVHLLLDIKDVKRIDRVRLLGARKDSRALRKIKDMSSIHITTKLADDKSGYYDDDIRCSDIYNLVVSKTSGINIDNDYSHELVII